MKSFKDYITMNEKAPGKRGSDLKVGDVILYGREDTPHEVTSKPKQDGPGYWVEVLNLSNKKKDKIYVDSGDTVTMNEKDLEDEVDHELNEEDFSKIMLLIDKDIKQIRDNLFEDSKTIGKVRRTIINADRKGTLHNIKPLQEVEQLMDKARRILTKI